MKLSLRTILLGIAAASAACTGGTSQQEAADNSASQESKEVTVTRAKSRRTTSPAIALRNMHAQISSMQRRVETFPSDIGSREVLVDLLLNRTKFLGSYDDFDMALALAKDAKQHAKEHASAGRVALLHAKVLSAVHRFDEALLEISAAETLGAHGTSQARQSIELARGNDAVEIVSLRTAEATRVPSYASRTALASALSSAGSYAKADVAYVDAKEGYRDVSPFPLAWISFQRGMMWGEMADKPDQAYKLYQNAVALLPQYIVGNVHLAELESARGENAQAIARLERIVNSTVDPEPASRLAEMLRDSDPERADKYAKRANDGYIKLLQKYPLAFADHATEFYLGEGNDPERALELAMLNLGNRQTERAYELALRAANAAGDAKLVTKLTAKLSVR
ncbi:MAG: tetratricopeptide repeat protein [Kofleriaceae bacterium]|nr:tetratricopeptide repeat protein [Kofleriaceae bacterium]